MVDVSPFVFAPAAFILTGDTDSGDSFPEDDEFRTLKRYLESVPLFCVVISNDCKVRFINRQGCETLGLGEKRSRSPDACTRSLIPSAR